MNNPDSISRLLTHHSHHGNSQFLYKCTNIRQCEGQIPLVKQKRCQRPIKEDFQLNQEVEISTHDDDWFVHSDFTAFGRLKISRVQMSLRGSHQLMTLCVLSLLHLVLSVQKLLSSVDWNLIQADSMVAGPDRETGGERVSV